MCCPHGHAFLSNPDYDYDDLESEPTICLEDESIKQYEPTFHNHNEDEVTSWTRNEQYLLVAPVEQRFQCDQIHGLNGSFVSMFEFGIVNPKLIIDGKLKGIVNNSISTVYWKAQEFCIVPTEEKDGSIGKYQYFICNVDIANTNDTIGIDVDICDKLVKNVHSVFLSISLVFLLLTLALYLIEPSLRKQFLFSRITMAFIVNLTITFIILVNKHFNTNTNLHENIRGGTIGKLCTGCPPKKL